MGHSFFIDFEGIGMVSRYHDLGLIYYLTIKAGEPEVYNTFMDG
jgi:hypothetical protein